MKPTLSQLFLIFLGCFPGLLLTQGNDALKAARSELARELRKDGIGDERVLAAMQAVKRHLFVPLNLREFAYKNQPLPIGEGQTISQPYVVARMTEALDLKKSYHVLEIGTGSGYQAAILSVLVDSVYSIEIKNRLAEQAPQRLGSLGYANIKTMCADGYFGWAEHAPFDAIIITCAVNHVPRPLLDQLKTGGRMVLPLGSTRYSQMLIRITKGKDDFQVQYLGSVAFVPMTGAAQKS